MVLQPWISWRPGTHGPSTTHAPPRAPHDLWPSPLTSSSSPTCSSSSWGSRVPHSLSFPTHQAAPVWALLISHRCLSPLVLQFFHCTCPAKPRSRSATLQPAWAALYTLAAEATAASWSPASLCPSVLRFVHRELPHCLQACGSAFRSLPSPSLTLHLAPTAPRKSEAIGKDLPPLPASFTLNILTSMLILYFPFSLVCKTEISLFLFRVQCLP